NPEALARIRAEISGKLNKKNKADLKSKKLLENHKKENGFNEDDKRKLINVLQIAGVIIFTAIMINSKIENIEPIKEKQNFTWNDALYLCQYNIKNLANDPEKAEVPYVENIGKGNEYYFAWGRSTKFARMRNGLGLEIPVSASCIVDGNQKRIVSLTIDGKTII
ncbi:hypothetical protein, partial [Methylicorpusculum sp.]